MGLFPYGCLFSFVGHDANSFYFILSGSVIVERMEEDKSTGEQHKQVRSYKQLSGVYRVLICDMWQTYKFCLLITLVARMMAIYYGSHAFKVEIIYNKN